MLTGPMQLVGRKNSVLTSPAAEVTDITEDIYGLTVRMSDTLRRASAYALAAPQVGQGLKIVLLSRDHLDLPPGVLDEIPGLTVLNPVIAELDGRMVAGTEGCLSLPGRLYEVERAERVFVTGINMRGEEIEIEAEGIEARMWQHEIDHLQGLLLVGRYPEVRRV